MFENPWLVAMKLFPLSSMKVVEDRRIAIVLCILEAILGAESRIRPL